MFKQIIKPLTCKAKWYYTVSNCCIIFNTVVYLSIVEIINSNNDFLLRIYNILVPKSYGITLFLFKVEKFRHNLQTEKNTMVKKNKLGHEAVKISLASRFAKMSYLYMRSWDVTRLLTTYLGQVKAQFLWNFLVAKYSESLLEFILNFIGLYKRLT